MVFKLKTSKRTMEIFKEIEKREHLQPFILAKIALSLSIKEKYSYDGGDLDDTLGLELNRQTITNEYDTLYKCLIQMNENKHIPEEQYFPAYVKAYLDNGAKILEREYKYSSSSDIYTHLLLKLDEGI